MPGFTLPKVPKTTSPAWWQAVKNKLAQLTPATPYPGYNTPKPPATGSFVAGGGTVAQGANGQTVSIPQAPPKPPAWMPTWLQPKPPTSGNPYQTIPTNPYNATPPKTPIPTGSFIAGGGSVVLGAHNQAVPTTIPTGSFVSGGGDYVLGSNQQAYLRDPSPNGTFIGAGGEAVRGPDVPIGMATPEAAPAGGSGYGYDYKKRRGGGGGGGSRDYNDSGYVARQGNAPAWARGLANWSIG